MLISVAEYFPHGFSRNETLISLLKFSSTDHAWVPLPRPTSCYMTMCVDFGTSVLFKLNSLDDAKARGDMYALDDVKVGG